MPVMAPSEKRKNLVQEFWDRGQLIKVFSKKRSSQAFGALMLFKQNGSSSFSSQNSGNFFTQSRKQGHATTFSQPDALDTLVTIATVRIRFCKSAKSKQSGNCLSRVKDRGRLVPVASSPDEQQQRICKSTINPKSLLRVCHAPCRHFSQFASRLYFD